MAPARSAPGAGRPHGHETLLLQDDRLPRRRLRHRHPQQAGTAAHRIGDLPGTEARKFFLAEFDDYIFIATHLCHLETTNRAQSVEIINAYIAANYASYTKPIFLAGDFNESNMSSEMMVKLKEKWEIISTSSNTFMNTATPKRIDYIVLYKGNKAACEVLGTAGPVVRRDQCQ